MVVLYRSNFHSLRLQKLLQTEGIPYEIRSGIAFFEQAHIKDLLAYIKVIFNPLNVLAWNRIFGMIPGLGRINGQKIYEEIVNLTEPIKNLSEISYISLNSKHIKISKQAMFFTSLFIYKIIKIVMFS